MNPKEKAKQGLSLLKDAILDLLIKNPDGLRCLEIARELDIRSDYGGKHKDYLPWSLLGLLVNEGLITCNNRIYKTIVQQ